MSPMAASSNPETKRTHPARGDAEAPALAACIFNLRLLFHRANAAPGPTPEILIPRLCDLPQLELLSNRDRHPVVRGQLDRRTSLVRLAYVLPLGELSSARLVGC